jgi:four helix bundle protein
MEIHDSFQFPHQKLIVWHLAREARRLTLLLLAELPAGYGEDARQIRRSAGATPKLIAEGGDRWAKGDKRRRFEEANGEAGETHAGLEDLAGLGALDPAKVAPVNNLWARVGAGLVGLIRRHS